MAIVNETKATTNKTTTHEYDLKKYRGINVGIKKVGINFSPQKVTISFSDFSHFLPSKIFAGFFLPTKIFADFFLYRLLFFR